MIELIGFEKEYSNVIKRYKSNNLPNSILIHGLSGIGKRTFLNKLVKNILNIEFKDNNYDHHLKLFNNNTHPNITIIEKETDSKTGKIKSNITIDQIRNLKTFINESSSIKGLSKFIIFDSADDLNINSANSFLKTLEEPKKNTFIFLISHQLSNLLPTIRSRCLKIKFNQHSFNNFKKIIKNNIENISDDETKFYYDLTYGSPGIALSLYDDNFLDILDITIKSLYSNKIDNVCINLADTLAKLENEKFKSYLSILKSLLINLKKLKIKQIDANNYLSYKFSILKDLSNKLSVQNIIDRFDFLSNNESDLFTYNLDKKIFMLKFLTT